MNEKDLLEFLRFIAEEDAQIGTIIGFFTNHLGYDVNILKKIVNYGVNLDVLQVIENNEDIKNYLVVKDNELNEIDWSTSNISNEIYFKDFDYFRKKLFGSNPKIPIEFRGFIN